MAPDGVTSKSLMFTTCLPKGTSAAPSAPGSRSSPLNSWNRSQPTQVSNSILEANLGRGAQPALKPGLLSAQAAEHDGAWVSARAAEPQRCLGPVGRRTEEDDARTAEEAT